MNYSFLLQRTFYIIRINKNILKPFNNEICSNILCNERNKLLRLNNLPRLNNVRFNQTLIQTSTTSLDDAIKQFRTEHQIFIENVENDRNIFNFNELNLPEKITELLIKNGYEKPTPIQAQALPILFSNNDLIGIAQTGSGKTLAFLLPIFNQLYQIHRNYWNNNNNNNNNDNNNLSDEKQCLNPRALILAPTRELAIQIFNVIKKFKLFKTICLYGGNDRKKQINYLKYNNPLILVSTPGRLKDLVDCNVINLNEINYLVIDEADRMLDMGFEPQISYLIDKCPSINERQTMMFSATWPDEVKLLVKKYLKLKYSFISIGGTKLIANHNIKQNIIICNDKNFNEKKLKLNNILRKHQNEKILIFCNRKIDCDYLSRFINKNNQQLLSLALHGDMTQKQRETTMEKFQTNEINILCATNVAARGIDIDNINLVINYDFPNDIETYIHRIGRTGRKNNKGQAYSFFNSDNSSLLAKKLIEILTESNNFVSDELIEISKRKNFEKQHQRYSQQQQRREQNYPKQFTRNRSSSYFD